MLAAAALLLLLQDAPAPAAGTGVFDDETGLWFPPGAPKDVYLAGTDPKHGYIKDLRAALAADPALRKEVCDWMSSPKTEARQVGGRTVQMRAMAHMVCAAIPAVAAETARQGKVDEDNRARWRSWLDLEGARALEWPARAERAAALARELDETRDADARLRDAFTALGLQPQDDAYLAALLDAYPYKGLRPEPAFRAFLAELYAAESAEGAAEPGRWKMGLRSYRYLSGDFAEARRLTEEMLAHPVVAEHEYDRVFLAVLDRILGSRQTFARLLADCPVPASYREAAAPDAPASSYCWQAARTIAFRGMHALGEKTPAPLKELVVEAIAAEPASWGWRLDSIRALAEVDHALARSECEALLRIPATIAPLGARLDSVAVLARIAKDEKDTPRALAAFDRYLDILEFKPPAAPPDLWTRLLATPEPAEGAPSVRTLDETNIYWALASKISLNVAAKDFGGARRLVEVYFSAALTRDPEGSAALAEAASGVRSRMVELARGLAAAGRRAEAVRICGFLYNQPHLERPDLVTDLSSLKVELSRGGPLELKPEVRPWDPAPAGPPPGNRIRSR